MIQLGNHESLYIQNATIYLERGKVTGSLLLEQGKIKELVTEDDTTPKPKEATIIDGTGLNIIPGFIDGHIHGAAGADTMDATESALDDIAGELPKEGTTSFLATTITQAPEQIDDALKNVASYTKKAGNADVLGVHLEGPFIEETKAGAQPVAYIMEPNLDQFNKWQAISGDQIRTITMAPEHDEKGLFIGELHRSGVNVSAGHTDANFVQIEQAIENGVRQLTHLCNAMNGIHHRDIGAVGASFQLEDLRAELIADGIHVEKHMLQLIYDNIGSDRIILITDSMRAKGLQPGEYDLGGQSVIVSEDRAMLESGSLAGSILKMDEGARIMRTLDGVELEEIVKMASVNPAKQIGVFDTKGSIAQNKDADLLIVDDGLNIKYTICRGVVAYKGE